MTSGFKARRSSDSWSGDDRHRDCLLPEDASQSTPGPCREQLSADLVEVGQRKHGLRSRQVLGQTAVSDLGEAPHLFDYAKGVFASRPGPRARPVDPPPSFAQGPLGLGAPVDPVAHSACFYNLPIGFFPVRLIAEDLPLLPVKQLGKLGDVGHAGMRSPSPYAPYRAIRSDVQLHPEVPVLPFSVCFISGSRVCTGVLGRTRRRDDGRVHDRPRSQQQPLLFQQSRDRLEDRPGSAHAAPADDENAKSWSRPAPRLAQLHPGKAPHRLAVVDRVFGLRVRQVEPLLQEVNPQHLLQSQRLATAARLGVVRLDQPPPAAPTESPHPSRQETARAASPCPSHPCHRGERPLIPHPRTSTPADPTNGLYQNRTLVQSFPSGSTAIVAQLDPEEWRETVSEYHRVAADAITRFGGHVVKIPRRRRGGVVRVASGA